MIGSDGYIDGSWKLKVFVTDLSVERELRVKGDLHIGGVLLKLVEDLGEFIKFGHFHVLKVHSYHVIVY